MPYDYEKGLQKTEIHLKYTVYIYICTYIYTYVFIYVITYIYAYIYIPNTMNNHDGKGMLYDYEKGLQKTEIYSYV